MLRFLTPSSAICAGLTMALTTGPAMASDPDPSAATPPSSGEVSKPALEQIGDQAEPLLPFDVLDLNHDGVLSTPEANRSPDLKRRWDALDANGDDVLDRSEMAVIYDTLPPTATEAQR